MQDRLTTQSAPRKGVEWKPLAKMTEFSKTQETPTNLKCSELHME